MPQGHKFFFKCTGNYYFTIPWTNSKEEKNEQRTVLDRGTGNGYKTLCGWPTYYQRKVFPFWHPREDQDAILLYPHIAFNTSYIDHNNPKTSFNILGWEKLEQDFGEHKSKEFAVEELTV